MEIDGEEAEYNTNNNSNQSKESKPSNCYFSKYFKNNEKLEIQKEKRMQEIDTNRREKRKQIFDLCRIFKENPISFEICNSIQIKRKTNFDIELSKLLMLAVNFVDIPKDLYKNYLMKYCPIGDRVIIVSQYNRTRIISREGKCISIIRSKFLGGYSDGSSQNKSNQSLLDGIIDYKRKKLYILDIIQYGTNNFHDLPPMDRFKYLQQTLPSSMESCDIEVDLEVVIVPALNCDRFSISSNVIYSFPVAGLLWYKRFDIYTNGASDSVIWIPLNKVEDILMSDNV